MRADEPDEVLIPRVRAGDRAAADAVVRRHTGLVKAAVKRLGPLPPSVEMDDLIQVGLLAVFRAAADTGRSAWQPGRGTKFSTYVYLPVRRDVYRAYQKVMPPGPDSLTDRQADAVSDRAATATPESVSADCLSACLPGLAPFDRVALGLVAGGATAAQAAARLGVPVERVAGAVGRARTALAAGGLDPVSLRNLLHAIAALLRQRTLPPEVSADVRRRSPARIAGSG